MVDLADSDLDKADETQIIDGVEKSAEWEELSNILKGFLKPDEGPTKLKLQQAIFRAAIKLVREKAGNLNLKIAATTIRELRYSFKMFAPYRNVPKITMFGSARVPVGTPLYEFAKNFAEEAVRRKFMIITGGGPGIMAAGNEGATAKGGFGLNIRLPIEQSPNPFIDTKQKLIHYKYFFTRKLFLVKEASAFAFFPGGFGTFDEAFEALTLLQTGKTALVPVVLVEPKGYGFWEAFSRFVDETALSRGFISDSDRYLFRTFHSSKEALDHIDRFYKNYHSMRFIGDQLVLRLRKALPDAVLKRMNQEFKGLLARGPIVASGALPEEINEPELKGFSRLIFPFERRDYGGLRRLVDFINENAV